MYLKVDLWRWGIRTTRTVHVLVAEAFVPRPANPLAIEVNHKDTDPFNNLASNLEWSTRLENEAHKRFWDALEEVAV